MKKIVLALLLGSGFLMAAEQQSVVTEQSNDSQQQQPVEAANATKDHVGYFARMALRTQAPAVHFKKGEAKTNYHVSENKTTIVATVPSSGK